MQITYKGFMIRGVWNKQQPQQGKQNTREFGCSGFRGASEGNLHKWQLGVKNTLLVIHTADKLRSYFLLFLWRLQTHVTYVGPFGGYICARQSSVYCK